MAENAPPSVRRARPRVPTRAPWWVVLPAAWALGCVDVVPDRPAPGAPPPPDPVVENDLRVDFGRWRPALDGYVPAVQLGNQRALGTRERAFVAYLEQMHANIHPAFASLFLEAEKESDAVDDTSLVTVVEIVLDAEDGRVLREGMVDTSGVTAFDVASLQAVDRAQPFGAAPEAARSPDGRVYVHWEFHRAADACAPENAHPFLVSRSDVQL